ncbi:MAG: hypothetical protein QGH47_02840 [Candidatus Woesearchaeota archaeon]|nr:hypothetical protein [Candidatus Woesearchaeota archaeon]
MIKFEIQNKVVYSILAICILLIAALFVGRIHCVHANPGSGPVQHPVACCKNM